MDAAAEVTEPPALAPAREVRPPAEPRPPGWGRSWRLMGVGGGVRPTWFLVLVPVARSGACVALGGKGLRWGWFVPFLPEQASLVRELLARCKVILLFSNSRGLSPCCADY